MPKDVCQKFKNKGAGREELLSFLVNECGGDKAHVWGWPFKKTLANDLCVCRTFSANGSRRNGGAPRKGASMSRLGSTRSSK